MSNIHDIEKQMADMADQLKRMQVELEAAKAAAAAKTEIEHFRASAPVPSVKRKAAPPHHPAGRAAARIAQLAPSPPPELVKEKKSKKSQIIDVPPCIMPARPKYGQLPTPAQPKPSPVPGAKRVGVINPMEVETNGVENSNPSTLLLAPARLGHEGTGLYLSRPSGGAASSSGHVKGDGKGGSKTGHWSSTEQTDLQQVEGSDTVQMLSVKDESDSRMAKIKACEEAVLACADSSPEEVQKALKWLAAVSARLLGSWRAKTRKPKTRTAATQTDAIEARLVERLHRTNAAKVYINKSGHKSHICKVCAKHRFCFVPGKDVMDSDLPTGDVSGHKSHICKVCVKHRFCFVPGKDVMGRDLPIDDVSAYTGKQKYVMQKIIEKDATKKQEYDDAVATRSRDVLRAYVNSQVPKNAKYGWTVVASS